MNIFRTGFALSITVALFYALCAIAWAMAPEAFMSLMNNLFHGIDFSSLVQASPFSWPGFLVALLVLSAWAMLAGAFFAWVSNRLSVGKS